VIHLASEPAPPVPLKGSLRPAPLLRELKKHLRQNRDLLLEKWSQQLEAAPLHATIDRKTIIEKAAFVYDDYLAALASGRVESLQSYFARRLPSELLDCGLEPRDVFRVIVLLRDLLTNGLLGRSLFVKFRHA